MPRLENYYVVFKDSTTREFVIVGKVYNDARFTEGEVITTGTIREFDKTKNTASTKRTTYILGEQNDFQKEFWGNLGLDLKL